MKSAKRKRWRKIRPVAQRYRFALDDNFAIAVKYWLKAGLVTNFAVVLVCAEKEKNLQICRYDTAHGYAHLDLLNTEGKVMKKIAISALLPYNLAIPYAIDDFKRNYQAYYQTFCEGEKRLR